MSDDDVIADSELVEEYQKLRTFIAIYEQRLLQVTAQRNLNLKAGVTPEDSQEYEQIVGLDTALEIFLEEKGKAEIP